MSWFTKGSNKEELRRQAEASKNSRDVPRRIWLPENSKIEVLYLDDEGFGFQEHAVQMPGRKSPEFITCVGLANGCLCCAAGLRNYFVTMYTVVDLTGWIDKDGKKHVNEKKIHALKAESALTLVDKAESWGGLRGQRVCIRRKSNRDANSGSDFEPVTKNGRVLRYKLDATDPKYAPFDYRKYFAPRPQEEVAMILRLAGHAVTLPTERSPSSKGFDSNQSIELPPADIDFGDDEPSMPLNDSPASGDLDGDMPPAF